MQPQTEIKIVREKAFSVIESAVNQMVDFIKPTYGPAGNKVIIDKHQYRMTVDDGVQIARDFELPDPHENAVVKLVREVAIRTNDRMGDGTTSSLIMIQAIIREVARKGNKNPRKIELELKKGLQEFKENIIQKRKAITSKEDLKKVALISFDNEQIAEMIANAYYKLGKDAIITIDRSPTMQTYIEISDGINIDSGYISPYMVNRPDRMEAEFENAYILLTDYRLTENKDIFPLMEKMVKEGKQNLIVIAENTEQQALSSMVINLPHVMNPQTQKLGTFSSAAINFPRSDDSKSFLEDLAILTGAKLFTSDMGDKLEMAEIADLGRAKKVIISKDNTIIIDPAGKKADIKKAISDLRSAIDKEPVEKTKKALQKRLGIFTNSIAVIKVGAPTENEQRALKYKVEDTVHAVKAAFQGGVVAGGGLALSRVETSSPILNEALKYPHKQLLENMGIEESVDIKDGEAYNVVTDKVGPFLSVGVVDPVEVLIAGVESAVSIACILITSPGILVEVAKPQPKQ